MENKIQEAENELFGMYEILGEMFSMNYTCLRISNQDIPFESSNVYGRSSVFENRNNLREKWIELKLDDAAEYRNESFADLFKAWEIQKQNLFGDIDFDAVLNMRKSELMKKYNDYFETNMTFNEAFDGFLPKDPRFKNIVREFETQAVYTAENEKLNYLLHEYHCYIEILKIQMAYAAFNRISSTLADDVSERGRPTLYFKRPKDPSIKTISIDEIEQHIATSEHAIEDTQEKLKAEGKKLIPLYKRRRKNMYDYDAHNAISQIKSVIFNLNERLKQAQEYSYFAQLLMQRLAYANTDYDNSKMSDIYEGFFDLTAGINIFKKGNKLKLDWVYTHSLEKKYLEYFAALFKESAALISQKTTAKQKT